MENSYLLEDVPRELLVNEKMRQAYKVLEFLFKVNEPLGESQWLEKRRESVGGSDTSTILGINSFAGSSPVQVYLSKIKGDSKSTASTSRGHYLEPYVLQQYAEKNKQHIVIKPAPDGMSRMFKHPDKDYIHGTPDGFIITRDGRIGILEFKTADSNGLYKWQAGLPEMYMIQVQQYLDVLQANVDEFFTLDEPLFAEIAYLLGDSYDCIPFVERDDKRVELIHQAIDEFWHNNILKRITPEPSIFQDVKDLYKEVIEASEMEATEEVVDLIQAIAYIDEKIAALKEPVKRYEDMKDKAKTLLGSLVEDYETVMFDDQPIVTWKKDKNGTRVMRLKPKNVEYVIKCREEQGEELADEQYMTEEPMEDWSHNDPMEL